MLQAPGCRYAGRIKVSREGEVLDGEWPLSFPVNVLFCPVGVIENRISAHLHSPRCSLSCGNQVTTKIQSQIHSLNSHWSRSVFFPLALLYFFPNTLLNPVSVNLYRTFPSFTLDTASLHPSSPS